MTVQELEELLARLPADMPVVLSGRGGHIATAYKDNRRRYTLHGSGTPIIPGTGPFEHLPACLRLDAYSWPERRQFSLFEPAPSVELRGNWPKAAKK